MTDPREPPSDDDDDDDLHAFRRAVADVRPLPRNRPATTRPRPRPHARFTRAERDDVLRESLVVPGDPADLDTGEHMSFRRPGLREDVLRKLKRGQFAVEAEIDLHGLGRHAAHQALRQFLNDCVLRGVRCVRVIHGKGLRSGPGGPVLKHVVNHWLRRLENVVAFASARPVDGGTGAVYVLLK
ncbi:MAG TPA: Smr/MutS family protein [Steroidobacteraceae bacterium]|nr:Smr/MutS family protein [Steroidobacteraceae bacterium]